MNKMIGSSYLGSLMRKMGVERWVSKMVCDHKPQREKDAFTVPRTKQNKKKKEKSNTSSHESIQRCGRVASGKSVASSTQRSGQAGRTASVSAADGTALNKTQIHDSVLTLRVVVVCFVFAPIIFDIFDHMHIDDTN